MGDAEQFGKRAAVGGDALENGSDDSCRKRRKRRVMRADRLDESKEIRLRNIIRHQAASAVAAFVRNDTSTDFEVGVSLSSPALDSGTSTLSSG